jgi:hypothetical protein
MIEFASNRCPTDNPPKDGISHQCIKMTKKYDGVRVVSYLAVGI